MVGGRLALAARTLAVGVRVHGVIGTGQQSGGDQQHPAVVALEVARVQHRGGALGLRSLVTPAVKPVADALAGTVAVRSIAVTSTSGSCWPVRR